MNYDVIIVGGGIAGLTSAAFLSKDGYKVLVCEKEEKVGGLVNSFNYKGFTFDGGIRAIENSGIVFPMLRQLGLEIDFIKNNVSIGIENEIIQLTSKASLVDYQHLLNHQFPDNTDDIQKIINELKRVMTYMDVLYGIDNPLFLDLKKDRAYLLKTVIPWMFKYFVTIKKIVKLDTPVYEYLEHFSKNPALIDMIGQHFFKNTPAFFALSYFSLYLDYQYPKGGTGAMIESMKTLLLDYKGEIRTQTEICKLNPQLKQIEDLNKNKFNYKKLIWASDLKKLYTIMDLESIEDATVKQKVLDQKNAVSNKIGGDSIFTLYLTLDLDKSFLKNLFSAHLFYTPSKKGLLTINLNDLKAKLSESGDANYISDKEAIFKWLRKYYELTTYEISCPVMRDANLAPKNQTGLIVSTLLDYSLVKHIFNMGWYEEFKRFSQECIITVLDATLLKGFKNKIIDQFSSTPLTLEKKTGNSQGAITGWAFTNAIIPVVSSLPDVGKSIDTPHPDIFQAGQWSFSPSGLPISVLTGKLAADAVKKQLK
ncbi:phytoene desaturase family protein [Acetobacterium bakii]|uniref:Amine oxidase domain-containing protein n=1 Tax=Acetobacterium bakii TaxID=52689 RepID=A0A0L6TZU0_9FIRM|nr:FAD-dependent oxidoreductase [Acetobacterium bakii]KNZ41779.1 hypothetical protein AKG39_09085 [Acetobacterium bakii]